MCIQANYHRRRIVRMNKIQEHIFFQLIVKEIMSSFYTLNCIFATRLQCILLYFVIDEFDATIV